MVMGIVRQIISSRLPVLIPMLQIIQSDTPVDYIPLKGPINPPIPGQDMF